MFASIPEFSTFSEQFKTTAEWFGCLRLLNELFSGVLIMLYIRIIINFVSDFDLLISEHKYSDLEKIKTVGSTYMVASGLHVCIHMFY